MGKAVVLAVMPGSISEELGITPGSEVLRVNGRAPLDTVDFRFEVAGTDVLLEVLSPDGEVTEYDVEKDYDDFLGIEFEEELFDGVHACENRCPFCFVRNLPEGLRSSLYLRDDDYRLSFLFGNFITLTNLGDSDFERIISQRLSPLYISVHSTDPDLRQRMLGNPKAADLMTHLQRLAQGGIDFHFQVVVTPEWNNGTSFETTLDDLRRIGDHALSIGIVPVGLTQFCRAPGIRLLTPDECKDLVGRIEQWKQSSGFDRAYPSDELLINAGVSIPSASAYGEYPQLENGVGMVRLFLDEAESLQVLSGASGSGRVGVVTGRSFEPFMTKFLRRYEGVRGLQVVPIAVDNAFFGKTVTVAGLLVGADIKDAIAHATEKFGHFDKVLVPTTCLNDGRFLDGVTLDEICTSLRTQVVAVPISPVALDERIVSL